MLVLGRKQEPYEMSMALEPDRSLFIFRFALLYVFNYEAGFDDECGNGQLRHVGIRILHNQANLSHSE